MRSTMAARAVEAAHRAGAHVAPFHPVTLRACRAWGFHIVYDDIAQKIIASPPSSGFGPVRMFDMQEPPTC